MNDVEIKHVKSYQQENKNDITSFDEHDIFDNKSNTHKNMEQYLIPEEYEDEEEIPKKVAENSYEMLWDILIYQFNKLREAYKEVFLHLKTKKNVELPAVINMLKKPKFMKDDLFERKDKNKSIRPNQKVIDNDDVDSESDDHIETQPSNHQDSNKPKPKENAENIDLKSKLTNWVVGFKFAIGNFFKGGKTDIMLNTNKVVNKIEAEKLRLSKNISKAWSEFTSLVEDFPVHLKRYHEAKYWRLYNQMIDEKRAVTKEVDELDEVLSDQRLKDLHNILNSKRKTYLESVAYETSRGLPGEKDIFMKKSSPIFYEEKWIIREESELEIPKASDDQKLPEVKREKTQTPGEPTHLVFFVHGFKGTHMDMYYLWNMLVLRCPKINPILCRSIENKTDDVNFNIDKLGKLLSEEVINEIDQHTDDDNFKISFVGHSLGGLVIRSAIRRLGIYQDNFQTLMTVGTPHWGYMHSKSRLLSLGIWIYDKTVTNPVLKQLRLGDSKDARETTIYNLSSHESMGWFKDIVIWGSEQDSFASIETSLIQETQRMSKRKKYDAIIEMQNNIQ